VVEDEGGSRPSSGWARISGTQILRILRTNAPNVCKRPRCRANSTADQAAFLAVQRHSVAVTTESFVPHVFGDLLICSDE
jgi:hypothetical protein